VSQELRIGLIGIAGGARPVYDALVAEPRVRIVAVADRNADAVGQVTASLDAEVYSDCRSLIVEKNLDALFVATPHFATHGCLRQAAEKGTPVWKQSPLARRFDEGLTLTQVFERAPRGAVPLAVARAWPAEPAMQQAGEILGSLGRPFLVEARSLTFRPDDLDWRGDSERAGAGVLLHQAYPAIDTVVHWLGPPSEVFASMGRISRPQTRHPYDTDDTATMVLRYPEGAMANFTTCWTSGPETNELTIHATEGILRIEPSRVVVLDRHGRPTRTPLDRSPNPYTHPIRAFLDGLLTEGARLASLAGDHLWTMAVLEAAYLSSRTGEAESPAKWFSVLSAETQLTRPGFARTVLGAGPKPGSSPEQPAA
jgi:predicted dehydrogenase